jgi:N-acetyl-1-D-myo-inositol-2-amino-2-deoxy-alpha-D-glucopyranoside deacetylase
VTGGLLVIGAHPDDEVLLGGGTLAACAAAGLPTGVVCLTRGEQGPIGDPRLATRASLAQVRVAELRAACAQLGVQWVKCYRRRDGSLPFSERSAIARQLAALLEARRPDAVITFGVDGLYHHPDHVATHELTLGAVERLADPPALYRSVWPRELISELARTLQERGLPDDMWGLEPDAFGTDDFVDSFAIDVRAFAELKVRALRAHRTQVPDSHAFATLDPELAKRFLGTEWFAPMNGASAWLEEAFAGG